MKTYTPRELRTAIILAVMLTAIAMLALLDRSCQPRPDPPGSGPSRSIHVGR